MKFVLAHGTQNPCNRPARVYNTHMHSKDLIRELQAAGWDVERIRGSHHQLVKNGQTITVPHPKKDLGNGLVAAIRKQAGLR